jgi:hypothetical protein
MSIRCASTTPVRVRQREKAEGRRQKAERRRQKAESRRRKAEGRKQKAEGRKQKAEGRTQKAERRRQNAEGRKVEDGKWKRRVETESGRRNVGVVCLLPSAFCLLPSPSPPALPGAEITSDAASEKLTVK